MRLPVKLLLVDDIPENIKLLAEYLADIYDIQCALSGSEALAQIAVRPPGLILLDVMMPGMDGYEVLRRLKSDPATEGIPVIFVTARNDAESESRALAAGAVDFIHKPINRDVARTRVRLHLDIKARERELQTLNRELERRVEERTRSLRDAMIQTLAAQRSRNLFLANVNHELRTPMNAIMGLSELMARQSDDPKYRERADRIAKAGKQLLELIENIIDIADLQAGKVNIETGDFDLPTLVDNALETWRSQAEAKGLSLASEIQPSLPTVLRGDVQRITQILDNFLSNAVKFSEQGCITLRARQQSSRGDVLLVRFEIEDFGVGLDPGKAETLFKIFEQADYSSTRQYKGVGIGLAICKQLTELMQGKIGVDSIPGQGSTFWVDLPLETAKIPMTAKSALPGQTLAPCLDNTRPALAEPSPGPVPATEVFQEDKNGCLLAEKPLPPAILCVDDEPSKLAVLRGILQEDYSLYFARSGEQALDAARKTRPSLILLDTQMPGMDGLATCRCLKADPSTWDIPVVLVMAPSEAAEERDCFDAGAEDYLTEPVLPLALAARVRLHLSQSRLARGLKPEEQRQETPT